MLAQIAGQARILLAPLDAHCSPGPRSGLSGALGLGVRRRGPGTDRGWRGSGRAVPWTAAAGLLRLRPGPAAGRVGLSPASTSDGSSSSAVPEASGVPMINPPALLRWNGDKSYLAELAEAGVPTVPTIAVEACCDADLEQARAPFRQRVAGDQAAGLRQARRGTHRLGPNDDIPADSRGRPMIIQPLIEQIATDRRIFAHAVRWRIQPCRRQTAEERATSASSRTSAASRFPRSRRPAPTTCTAGTGSRSSARSLRPRRHGSRRRWRPADHGARADRAGAVPRPCARSRRGAGASPRTATA